MSSFLRTLRSGYYRKEQNKYIVKEKYKGIKQTIGYRSRAATAQKAFQLGKDINGNWEKFYKYILIRGRKRKVLIHC